MFGALTAWEVLGKDVARWMLYLILPQKFISEMYFLLSQVQDTKTLNTEARMSCQLRAGLLLLVTLAAEVSW